MESLITTVFVFALSWSGTRAVKLTLLGENADEEEIAKSMDVTIIYFLMCVSLSILDEYYPEMTASDYAPLALIQLLITTYVFTFLITDYTDDPAKKDEFLIEPSLKTILPAAVVMAMIVTLIASAIGEILRTSIPYFIRSI